MDLSDRYSFEKICVPEGWTAADDIAEVEDIFGSPVDDYFGEALERIADYRDALQEALERRLIRFGEGKNSASVGGIPDKIAKLEQILESASARTLEGPLTDSYRSRLDEDLRYCRFVWEEHERIMAIYSRDGERTFLHPLIDLADHLSSAVGGLEGAF